MGNMHSFLIEGLICVVVGITSFFVMPPSITEPALAFKRPDGTNKWWTEEEEKILVNRLLRDDPTKGDMNNRTAVSFKKILKTIIDPDLLPIYIVSNLRQSCCSILLGLANQRCNSLVSSFGFPSSPRQTTSR